MKTFDTATLCGKLADDKKAQDVAIIELADLTDIADYFVVVSATNERQVRSIADNVETGMKSQGFQPFSREGYDEGRWVILDYQSVVIHIFLENLRELYDLESLWLEAKKYRLEKENTSSEVGYGERTT